MAFKYEMGITIKFTKGAGMDSGAGRVVGRSEYIDRENVYNIETVTESGAAEVMRIFESQIIA